MLKLYECSEVTRREWWENRHRWHGVAIWEGGNGSEKAIWES